jgi:hypothetical protein
MEKESAGARRKSSIEEKKGAYVRPARQAWILADANFTPCVTPFFKSLPCWNTRNAVAKVGGGSGRSRM